MEYNQQRRSRGGYGYRRPGNPGCGCRPAPAPSKPDCGCRPQPEAARPDCGCRPQPAPVRPDCGCRPQPAPARPDCGCQPAPAPSKPDCGCRPALAPSRPDCGRRPMPAPSKPDCGCGHSHTAGAGIDSFEIAMAYVPWQTWKCTYDPHRSLMSGTIFPELDKPFCAAGRCNR